MPNAAGRKWLAACSISALCLAAVPFAWRSDLSIWVIVMGCLFPVWGVLAIVFAIRWLLRNKVPVAPLAIGASVVLAGLAIALGGDKVARAAIFRINYEGYRACAASQGHDQGGQPPPVTGYGVEDWEVVDKEGTRALVINTASGPTLETVVFSPTPLTTWNSYTLRLVRKDDLGYWYFAEPVPGPD